MNEPATARVAKAAFWSAMAFAVAMAVMPQPPYVFVDRMGDKVEHILAFSVMAVLAAIAYRETPLLRLAERLLFLGAMIELVQSIPGLHRDCDIRDWIADSLAVLILLLAVHLWRRMGAAAGS